MDTIQLITEISVLKKKMDKAEAFLEELVEYLLVTCKDDDYITPEVICRKLAKYGYIELENGYWVNPLADRKTENSSEKPNNCEDEFFREPTAEERKAVADYIDSISVPTGVNIFDLMDEPTISKMEQVEDEPQTYVINPQEPTNDDKCFECDDFFTCGGQCNKIETEPQTCSVNGRPYSECGNCEYHKCTADEPQTERSSE